jgi:hypothetical protein
MMAKDPPEGTRLPTAMVWPAAMVRVAPPETVRDAVLVVPVPASAPLIVPGKVQEEETEIFPLAGTVQSTANTWRGDNAIAPARSIMPMTILITLFLMAVATKGTSLYG